MANGSLSSLRPAVGAVPTPGIRSSSGQQQLSETGPTEQLQARVAQLESSLRGSELSVEARDAAVEELAELRRRLTQVSEFSVGLTPRPPVALDGGVTQPRGGRFQPDAQVSLTSNDPGLRIIAEGPGTWRFTGAAKANRSTPAVVRLQLQGRSLDVPLSAGQSPDQVLEAIIAALPEGFEAVPYRSSGQERVVSIGHRVAQPPPPDFGFEVNLANDPGQRVQFTGGDTLSIRGSATGGGIIPSMIQLTVGGTRVRLPVTAGDSALATAGKLCAALPPGFCASVQGADPVTVQLRRG
jgi:hypothetical protein